MTPRKHRSAVAAAGRCPRDPAGVRIIGGRFRGRTILYHGDPRVRPMKHRLREAIFSRIGAAVVGKHAVDLFAGTGALGLEAISRGAARATLIEQHFPTAETIRQNVAALGVGPITQIVTSSVFIWQKRRPDLGPVPCLVFCSPPYDFYLERTDEMLALIDGLMHSAPPESVFVVESDGRFDPGRLPDPRAWDVRPCRPAVVAVHVGPR